MRIGYFQWIIVSYRTIDCERTQIEKQHNIYFNILKAKLRAIVGQIQLSGQDSFRVALQFIRCFRTLRSFRIRLSRKDRKWKITAQTGGVYFIYEIKRSKLHAHRMRYLLYYWMNKILWKSKPVCLKSFKNIILRFNRF